MRFRSNPLVELRQLKDLAAEEREAFRDLESDPDFHGLFVPRPPLMMNLQSVARPTAKLFQSLATPACLDDPCDDVVDLVLDGILEVESGDGFVSGADALPIVSPPAAEPEPRNAAARLSRDALLHAEDLETRDPHRLATALYLYNRIPLSPFWKTRFANGDAILAHLGADRGSLHALLEGHWYASYRSTNGWLSWTSKTPVPRNEDQVNYKLYISPRPERIRDAFEVVVRVLSGFGGVPFKIGNGPAGLLRPDKLVAYFTTREELGEAGEMLHRELSGCDAHGVPFSAGLDDDGLLSWGVDPPENDRVLKWLAHDSWRLWVAKRLGAALSIAKSANRRTAVEPRRFAIERARRHGVDVDTWTPAAALWSTQ